MKNVDDLYEKYYNAYKNDYDNDDELSEGKKKKIDYKQFELFDEIDEKLTEAIKLIEDIKADRNNVTSSGDKNFLMI